MTRGKSWTHDEDAILFEERAKGTIFKTISFILGRPMNGCEQRYSFLRRNRPDYQPKKRIDLAQMARMPEKPNGFRLPDKRRCLCECRQWFAPSHIGQYFIIGHKKADDTGMLERSANYGTPARMSF